MTLHYLEFDYSEDDEGTGTWDAIASVPAAHLPALQAEIVAVLSWAHLEFPGLRGPMEDGGMWDYDLQNEPDNAPLQALHFDEAARQLQPPLAATPATRHTLTLSLNGHPAFALALRERFALQ